MKRQIDVSLHSDFSPEGCLARLAEQIDVDRFTPFSFSGYRGSRPVLGRIAGNEFRLHKRRYWHNSFGPVLFGRVVPDGKGSAIEGYWDIWLSPRLFMWIWTALAIAFGTPIFLVTLRDIFRAWPAVGDKWIGIVAPVALVLGGVCCRASGRL